MKNLDNGVLTKGSQKFAMKTGARVEITSNGVFQVYGVRDGKRVSILGPRNESDRYFKFWNKNYTALEVVTDKETFWNCKYYDQEMGQEYLDPTPIEVPVMDPALNMNERIRQFIRDEISARMESQDMETFEESMDFDVDDDTEIISPYEFVDMVPEEPVDEAQAPTEPATIGGEATTTAEPDQTVQEPESAPPT
jgi:hypothetical protein